MDDRHASVIGSKYRACTRYMGAPSGWLLVEVVAILSDAQAYFQSPLERRRLVAPDLRFGTDKGETAG